MLASSIMRSNSTYDDIAGIGAIPLLEWKVFLQGSIMANMMSDKELAEHDGKPFIFVVKKKKNTSKCSESEISLSPVLYPSFPPPPPPPPFKACFPGASKGVIVWEWVKPLPFNLEF